MTTTTAPKAAKPRATKIKETPAPPSPYTPTGMLDWNPQWDGFGGDCAALDAYSERSGIPFAKPDNTQAMFPSLQGRGTLIHRFDPTLIFNWAWYDSDGSKHTEFVVGNTLRAKAYRPALVTEFALNPALRGTIAVDTTGRYVVTDMNGKTMATVMVRDKAAWLRDRKDQLKFSDFIQGAAEQKANDITEKLQRAGVNATTTFQMEDVDSFQPDPGDNL